MRSRYLVAFSLMLGCAPGYGAASGDLRDGPRPIPPTPIPPVAADAWQARALGTRPELVVVRRFVSTYNADCYNGYIRFPDPYLHTGWQRQERLEGPAAADGDPLDVVCINIPAPGATHRLSSSAEALPNGVLLYRDRSPREPSNFLLPNGMLIMASGPAANAVRAFLASPPVPFNQLSLLPLPEGIMLWDFDGRPFGPRVFELRWIVDDGAQTMFQWSRQDAAANATGAFSMSRASRYYRYHDVDQWRNGLDYMMVSVPSEPMAR